MLLLAAADAMLGKPIGMDALHELFSVRDAVAAEAHATPPPPSEPAVVLQALVERLNPVTPAAGPGENYMTNIVTHRDGVQTRLVDGVMFRLTPQLRWNNGSLEQCWKDIASNTLLWLPVPAIVEETTSG